jgi:hypothetical protein
MATVTALTTRKNPESPERGALRAAIARVAEVKSEVGAIEGAIEGATHLAMACRQKLEKATKAVTAAKAEDAERLAAALISGISAPPQQVRRAREQEVEAADALGAARSAITRLEADLKHAQYMAEGADKAVRAAVAAIMAPLAEKMREEARDLRSKYLMRMYATGAMVESGLDGVAPVLFDIREEEHRQFCAAVRRPWFDVIEALRRDADAALPAIEGN